MSRIPDFSTVAFRIAPGGRIDTRLGAADDPVGIRGRLEGAAGSGR